MERNDPRSRSDAYGSRINRSHSPIIANAVPWISIVIGSILPLLMTIALTALEFLVAALQAYVFAVLTCMYLNDAVHPHH